MQNTNSACIIAMNKLVTLIKSLIGVRLLGRCLLTTYVIVTWGHAQEQLEIESAVKQLFLDDDLICEVHNIRRVIHQPIKITPEPVIRPEHSWENVIVGTRNAPFWVPDEKIWKLYYHGAAMEHKADGQSRLTYRQCLAISLDGLLWSKPKLGLVEWEGSKENNIVTSSEDFLYHVIYDAKGGNECYKGLFTTSGMSDRKPAVSSDGLHWRLLDVPAIPSQDQSKLIYDEVGRQYLLTVKHEGPYGRSVYLSISKDFRDWSKPRLIFHTDGEDQELSRKRIAARMTDARFVPLTVNRPADYNVDVYNMPIFPYEGFYVGMPMLFNQSGQTPIGNSDGFHHIELVTSRDLIGFERVASRAPFMETSYLGSGSYDIAQLIPADRPVVRGGELWFYSSGNKGRFIPSAIQTLSDGSKRFGFPTDTGAIHLSRLRLDGFVSMDAGDLDGSLITRPIVLRGQHLFVNAQVREGGFLRAEILDATGRKPVAEVLNASGRVPIKGFTLSDAITVTGDQLEAPLAWQGGNDLESLAGKEVRVRFTLQNASLYAFWVKD
jgi:hypothetical protein